MSIEYDTSFSLQANWLKIWKATRLLNMSIVEALFRAQLHIWKHKKHTHILKHNFISEVWLSVCDWCQCILIKLTIEIKAITRHSKKWYDTKWLFMFVFSIYLHVNDTICYMYWYELKSYTWLHDIIWCLRNNKMLTKICYAYHDDVEETKLTNNMAHSKKYILIWDVWKLKHSTQKILTTSILFISFFRLHRIF